MQFTGRVTLTDGKTYDLSGTATEVITPPSGQEIGSATPPGSADTVGYTMVDKSWKFPNGAHVSQIGMYSTVAQMIYMKIVNRVSATDWEVISTLQCAHLGTGKELFSTSYDVPATGDYYLASYINSTVPINSGTTRAYKAGNLAVGTSTGWTEDTGNTRAHRAMI